jgi:hypothetical protein
VPRIRYIGPIDGVDIVIAGLSDVRRDSEFDVAADVAAVLLTDDSMYVPAKASAKADTAPEG